MRGKKPTAFKNKRTEKKWKKVNTKRKKRWKSAVTDTIDNNSGARCFRRGWSWWFLIEVVAE